MSNNPHVEKTLPAAPSPPGPPAEPRSRLSRILDWLEPLLLIVVPVVLAASIIFEFKQTALLSAMVAMVALLPFFLRFENTSVKPRDIMPIVVMAALAVALRIVMTPVFYLSPVSAMVIISGLGFGKRSGFMTGALIAIVSNLFLSQGPWTPWQMYNWGLMGYLAGAIADKEFMKKRWQVCVFGAIMSLFYNVVMDTYSAFGFMGASSSQSIAAVYLAGLSYGASHVFSTVVFLFLIYKPWMLKFTRIKAKYGIGETI